jgi:hypothetical protein
MKQAELSNRGVITDIAKLSIFPDYPIGKSATFFVGHSIFTQYKVYFFRAPYTYFHHFIDKDKFRLGKHISLMNREVSAMMKKGWNIRV